MKSGLKFSLKNGEYRALTISHSNPRKCWCPEFQNALLSIAPDTYPRVTYTPDGRDPSAIFYKNNPLGVEILRGSKTYEERKPSASEVARIQNQIERMHALAVDPNMPSDIREFFLNFQLPDPRYMPECWRTTGFFKKKLHIIWGLTKIGKQSTFLPASDTASEWKDGQIRTPLGAAFGYDSGSRIGSSENTETSGTNGCSRAGCLGRAFSWLLRILLLSLTVSLLYSCLRGCTSSPHSFDGGSEIPRTVTDVPTVKNDQSGDCKNDNKKDDTFGNVECPREVTTSLPTTPSPVSGIESANALSFKFKVNQPRELSGSNDDVAKVEFSVSPTDDLGTKEFVAFDWTVNGEIEKSDKGKSFIPEDGLRFDKSYTISVTVTVDGKPQRVEPFQWNTIDAPTWQIIEVGRNAQEGMRKYKLICCNSSSIKPMVKDWKVNFRTKDQKEDRSLNFEVVSKKLNDTMFEMKKSIGYFEGTYFMEMSVDVVYVARGHTNEVTHVETFPFTHDSSADGLTRAKYETVIPNVYFCLARLNNGSLINGTAFAISEKLLLTNYHVAVGGIPECYANSGDYKVVGPVKLTNVKGMTFYSKIDRFDRGRDLAILRLCDKDGKDVDDRLPGYLHLAEDALVAKISETSARHVFAVGYPKGTVCMGPPAFTDGKAEKIFKRNYDWRGNRQTFDTIINYTNTECGYSGGPLVDYETDTVLGVNYGGLIEQLEGHKAASLATSAAEVRLGFSNLKKK